MKTIIRMLVFSAVALYLTSYWNKGFILSTDILNFTLITVIVAVICYLVLPISKIVLFPLNLLTMGMMSVITYVILIYLLDRFSPAVTIKDWIFPGITLLGLTIQKTQLNYLINLFLTSFSLSVIINLLELAL